MRKKRILLRLLVLMLLCWSAEYARAAVFKVTTTADGVTGSLRDALKKANANTVDDTIQLPAGVYLLKGSQREDVNKGGDLDINTTNALTIVGDGAKTTIIDGGFRDRVLHIIKGKVTISGVTIRNGKTYSGAEGMEENGEPGGGIYNNGTLTLNACVITGNTAGNGSDGHFGAGGRVTWPGEGGQGGGIYNSNTGILTITKSTISKNQSGYGCLYDMDGEVGSDGGSGGGIFNLGTLSLTLCTIAGNATGEGGISNVGIEPGLNHGYGGGICSAGTLTLKSCTVVNNFTRKDYNYSGLHGRGGGIYSATSATLNLQNTIIANNSVPQNCPGADCFGVIKSQGYNLLKDTTGYTIKGTTTGNQLGVNPMLGTLALYGGQTPTIPLQNLSPAIDAGISAGLKEDQRGYVRSVDIAGVANVADSTDIGAYEANATKASTTLSISTTQLNLSTNLASTALPTQTFKINISGSDILNWTVKSDAPWLTCSPASGSDSATVSVKVNTTKLNVGTYTATITVDAPNVTNAPLYITVKLTVI